jgi:hypothetical protein
MMKAHWVGLALFALAAPGYSSAQTVKVGERVRIQATDMERHTGTLVAITPGELLLNEDGEEVAVSRDGLRTIERSLGERRHLGRNFLITTLAGGLALGTIAAASTPCQSVCDGPGSGGRGAQFAFGAVVGAVIAAPIGLIVGATVYSDEWEPAALPTPPDASLTLTPLGDGRVALGASIRLGPRPHAR